MTLIKCGECGKEISEQAKTCPNCGARTQKSKKQSRTTVKFIIVIVIIAVLAVIIGVSSNEAKKKDLMYQCGTEAINILEDYKARRIEAKQAAKELATIEYKLKEYEEQIKEENEDKSWKCSYLASSIASVVIDLDSPFDTIDNVEINEYIEKIKERMK